MHHEIAALPVAHTLLGAPPGGHFVGQLVGGGTQHIAAALAGFDQALSREPHQGDAHIVVADAEQRAGRDALFGTQRLAIAGEQQV